MQRCILLQVLLICAIFLVKPNAAQGETNKVKTTSLLIQGIVYNNGNPLELNEIDGTTQNFIQQLLCQSLEAGLTAIKDSRQSCKLQEITKANPSSNQLTAKTNITLKTETEVDTVELEKQLAAIASAQTGMYYGNGATITPATAPTTATTTTTTEVSTVTPISTMSESSTPPSETSTDTTTPSPEGSTSLVPTKYLLLEGNLVVGPNPIPWNPVFQTGNSFVLLQQSVCNSLKEGVTLLANAWEMCQINDVNEATANPGQTFARVLLTLNGEHALSTSEIQQQVRTIPTRFPTYTTFGEAVQVTAGVFTNPSTASTSSTTTLATTSSTDFGSKLTISLGTLFAAVLMPVFIN